MEGLGKVNPEYPVLLMKIAGIELSRGNASKCIELAMKAIKSSENKNIFDSTLIKIY
jgi:hypothetical protein